jgi:predicted small integral membrane protein
MKKAKQLFTKVAGWIDSKGFSALLSLGLGLGLWLFGYQVYAGIAFGVFLTRNWDLLRGLVKK